MLNRRGFLGAISAALSLVGIKLPQAKGVVVSGGQLKTFTLAANGTYPGQLIPLNTDQPFPVVAVADFRYGNRIYFDLPCDCMFREFFFSPGDRIASTVAVTRDLKGPSLVELAVLADYTASWRAPIGRELVLRKGRFWMTSNRISEGKMSIFLIPLHLAAIA